MRTLRRLFEKSRAERELDQELQFHLDEQIADYVSKGLTRDEAHRQARMEFGGLERVKEEVRESHWETAIGDFFADLRYGLRALVKNPGFTVSAVFTLALGIGATTAMFGVIHNLLFDPFPYKAADRLAMINIHNLEQESEGDRQEFSIPEFLDYRRQNHVFEDLIGSYSTLVTLEDGDSTRKFGAGYVTGNSFQFYGIPPLLGRGIAPEDAQPGAAPVFAMNYKLWVADFHADPQVVGKSFLVDGKKRMLVGIMPPRFQAGGSPLWFPLDLSSGAEDTKLEGNIPVRLWTVGRLKPGTNLGAAAADMQVLAKNLSKVYRGEYPKKFTVTVRNFAESIVGNFRIMLYALLGAVAILLLMACGNVANLLLARATTREHEIGVRIALGAGPGRLIRQLLVESFVLAALACLAGCFLAYLGLQGISATIPRDPLPDEAVIGFSPMVLFFAMMLSLLTTVICGLAPAVHALRGNLTERLTGSGKGAGGSLRYGPFRSTLVIAEVALSVVLLIGAGLLTHSFVALTHIDLGFNPQNILFAQFAVPPKRNQTPADQRLFFDQVLPHVQALPGVVAAAAAYSLPPSWGTYSDATVPGKTHEEHWFTRLDLCSAGYFLTLGLHLQAGRTLSESDIVSARRVMVVNESLARKFFANENPIGQRVKFDVFDQIAGAPHDAYFEIVGVVGDFSNWDVRKSPLPEALLPYTISAHGDRIILARTSVPPDALLPAVRREIWAVDPKIAITFTGTLAGLLSENSYTEPRFDLISSGAFAGIGLLLVLMGVSSVLAYTVSLRIHEIGIRMALGATPGGILKMVLVKGLQLIVAGVVVGLLLSFALTRLIASQIWGVSVMDPVTFLSVVALVILLGCVACLVPARRAASLDPLVALHYE